MITIALFVYEKFIIKNTTSSNVISLSVSDHDCIVCVRKINHKKTLPRERICRNYRHYDLITFNNNLKNLPWSPLYTCSNVNDASNILEQNLTGTMGNHALKIKTIFKGRRCPCLSTEIKKVMDERDKILRKTRQDSDWSNYKQLKNQ